MTQARNVFGQPLQKCCDKPRTGYYRDGYCNTGDLDFGLHVVCARVTAEFLEYTKLQGNDLSTPAPEYQFPGLKPGDCWCLCASRWKQAFNAGCAPQVNLAATHSRALEVVSLEELKEYAI